VVAAVGAGCAAPPGPAAVDVYAAASLRDVLSELAPRCEPDVGAPVVFNFGASSDLARQIRAARRADVFLSADEAWMDELEAAGLLKEGTRRSLLSNRIVVIARRDSGLSIDSAAALSGPEISRISLALPDVVPAGRYAKRWLEKEGVWAQVEPRVIPAVDVRAAMAAVESGAVPVGIVYRTDAAICSKVRVLYDVPESEEPEISYPVAVLNDADHPAGALRFVSCLESPRAREVFARFGFLAPAIGEP